MGSDAQNSGVLAHLLHTVASVMFGVRVVCSFVLRKDIIDATVSVQLCHLVLCVPDSTNLHSQN